MKQSTLLVAVSVLVLGACQSTSTHYNAKSINAAGTVLNSKTNLSTNKEGIDIAVKTLCQANRNARQVIVETRFGRAVQGSPFSCR